MDGKNYQKGYHVGRHQRGVKEKPWSHDDLNVLQLDLFERTVVKIAGKKAILMIPISDKAQLYDSLLFSHHV